MKRSLTTVLMLGAFVALGSHGTLAAKRDLVGACACKKGKSVLSSYSAKVCVQNDHAGCTTAKVRCVNENVAACDGQGGTVSQSTAPCTGYNDKC